MWKCKLLHPQLFLYISSTLNRLVSHTMRLKILFFFTWFFIHVQSSVPVVMYSHKLIPKIQEYIRHYNHLQMPYKRVNEVAKKMLDACSADAIILVNQPGLTMDDLQEYEPFTMLRTYCFMSSTLGVVPRLQRPLDLDKLADYALKKCGGDLIRVEGLDEVETYIDSGRRIIRINFPPLPQDSDSRREALMQSDHALRNSLRKLPSPYHMMIYTSMDERPLNKNQENRWKSMEIFPDISKDASRSIEFERNDKVMDVERYFPAKRTGLLNRTRFQGSRILDQDVIYDNELLILGIVIITIVLAMYQLMKLFIMLFNLIFRFRPKAEKNKTE